MPTSLPPRGRASKSQSDYSPLLVIIAGLLALVLVLAEAQAMGALEWSAFSPDPSLIVPP